MKRPAHLCGWLVLFLLGSATARSEDQGAATAAPPPPTRVQDEAGPRAGPGRATGGERRYVDEWLNGLQATDPKEFERMRLLRRNDPDAFRAALREKVEHARSGGLQDRPAIASALGQLPPKDREWLMSRLRRGGPNEGRMGMMNPREVASPEIEAGEQRARELAVDYRHEQDPAVQQQKGEALRAHLNHLYDLRSEAREKQLHLIEERVQKLREELKARDARRQDIVDERFRAITGSGDTISW